MTSDQKIDKLIDKFDGLVSSVNELVIEMRLARHDHDTLRRDFDKHQDNASARIDRLEEELDKRVKLSWVVASLSFTATLVFVGSAIYDNYTTTKALNQTLKVAKTIEPPTKDLVV